MTRLERDELERQVQALERHRSGMTARQIESELKDLFPVAYGNWKDDTPDLRSRLRQIQRWRKGSTGSPRPVGRQELLHVWPVGEAQRHEADPAFPWARPRATASHRLFLKNCSAEAIHEIGVTLAGKPVAFEPVLEPGRFTEIHWVRNEAIRAAALAAPANEHLRHKLSVEYAYGKGLKHGRFEGELVMDAMDGWISFVSKEGAEKEIL